MGRKRWKHLELNGESQYKTEAMIGIISGWLGVRVPASGRWSLSTHKAPWAKKVGVMVDAVNEDFSFLQIKRHTHVVQ